MSVFILTSISMEVFAERPGDRQTERNPITQYLWGMTHYREITELGKTIDYAQGRIYIFKRMKGSPYAWGGEEKEQYDQMYAEQRVRIDRYNNLIAQYNDGRNGSETGFSPKAYSLGYMPYATR